MKQQFFFSTKALIMKDAKFLAVYSLIEGTKWWDLPGGRMEFGETAEETLAREIMEELRVVIKPIKLIDTWNYMPNKYTQITGVIYHCKIMSGEITISDEHNGYEWININDIEKVFTREAFVERMNLWNWELVMDDRISFKRR